MPNVKGIKIEGTQFCHKQLSNTQELATISSIQNIKE